MPACMHMHSPHCDADVCTWAVAVGGADAYADPVLMEGGKMMQMKIKYASPGSPHK